MSPCNKEHIEDYEMWTGLKWTKINNGTSILRKTFIANKTEDYYEKSDKRSKEMDGILKELKSELEELYKGDL